jgi:hypothetical protein
VKQETRTSGGARIAMGHCDGSEGRAKGGGGGGSGASGTLVCKGMLYEHSKGNVRREAAARTLRPVGFAVGCVRFSAIHAIKDTYTVQIGSGGCNRGPQSFRERGRRRDCTYSSCGYSERSLYMYGRGRPVIFTHAPNMRLTQDRDE